MTATKFDTLLLVVKVIAISAAIHVAFADEIVRVLSVNVKVGAPPPLELNERIVASVDSDAAREPRDESMASK